MASDYGDLSRIALEADLDPDELRARLARMIDRALLEWGKAAAYICAAGGRISESLRARYSSPSSKRPGPSGAAGTARNHLPPRNCQTVLFGEAVQSVKRYRCTAAIPKRYRLG